MTLPRIWLSVGLLTASPPAIAEEPRPAITVRLDHPDRQARAVIDLFRGARAPHPAAALAAWKRASREPDRLGKPLEALIASINPSMAEELRLLDGGELALWSDPDSGKLDWGAILPKDDGTFAALATAFALSGGAALGSVDGLEVDRLGPPGSALMARGPRALLIGGSTAGLEEAHIRSDRPKGAEAGGPIQFALDPRALDGSKSINARRWQMILGGLRGSIGLDRSTLAAQILLRGATPTRLAPINPDWLDWLPVDRASAAFAIAIDPAPSTWEAAFDLADRVEKADPARQGVAPSRLRLDLIGRTLGLRVEELLPHLEGVAGWVGADSRSIDRAMLMLHLDDEDVASRVFDRLKPPPGSTPPLGPVEMPGRWLGQIDGRAVRVYRIGPALVATWGEGVIEASVDSKARPERSARSIFGDRGIEPRPSALGVAWPARIPGLLPRETPLATALVEASPILWIGARKGPDAYQLEASWKGLDRAVRRFLELIPLDPPPDR